MMMMEQLKEASLGIIRKVVSHSMADMYSSLDKMTKDRIYDKPEELLLRIELYLADQKEKVRKDLYNELFSEAMKHDSHPFRVIIGLGISRLNQIVLYMLQLEFSIDEIAHILLSDKTSIMTLRSSLRKQYLISCK